MYTILRPRGLDAGSEIHDALEAGSEGFAARFAIHLPAEDATEAGNQPEDVIQSRRLGRQRLAGKR